MNRHQFAFAAILALFAISTPISRAQSERTNKPKKAASVSITATAVGPATATSDSAKSGSPVATIDGQPIFESDLAAAVESRLMPLRAQERSQEYQIKKQALENLVDQKLIEAVARKKGLSTDKLLEQEADAKVADPADAEVYAFYLGARRQWGDRSFDDVKAQVKASLKQAKVEQARQDFYKRLHKQSQIAILLEPPRVNVAYDPARVRGNPKAPIMIVEFADFQCPYCKAAEPTLDAVFAKYKGQVAISYRDFPLASIHPHAQEAAEAARCAEEQGKFWQYHDLLFANQDKLDHDGLLQEAASLKLDEKQFAACLAAQKYKAEIAQDEQAGRSAGVNGTPAFFVNGVFLNGAQPQSVFEDSIDDALALAQNKPSGKGN